MPLEFGIILSVFLAILAAVIVRALRGGGTNGGAGQSRHTDNAFTGGSSHHDSDGSGSGGGGGGD